MMTTWDNWAWGAVHRATITTTGIGTREKEGGGGGGQISSTFNVCEVQTASCS